MDEESYTKREVESLFNSMIKTVQEVFNVIMQDSPEQFTESDDMAMAVSKVISDFVFKYAHFYNESIYEVYEKYRQEQKSKFTIVRNDD